MLVFLSKLFVVAFHCFLILEIDARSHYLAVSGVTRNESLDFNDPNSLRDGFSIATKNYRTKEGELRSIESFVGFSSDIHEIYDLAQSLVTVSKQTIEDVMNIFSTELRVVERDLDKTKDKFSQTDFEDNISLVKTALRTAENYIKNRNVENKNRLRTRAIALHSRLDKFLEKILQVNVLLDVFKILQELYDCGSKSIMKHVENYITLVNMGALGIGYYSKQINDESLYDGEALIKTLNDKKNKVLERVNNIQKECAVLTKEIVDQHILKMLSSMPKASIISVNKALYNLFDDIYPSNINWIFYATTNSHFRPGVPMYHSVYSGKGISGHTEKGNWIVHWAGNPTAQGQSIESLQVNSKELESTLVNINRNILLRSDNIPKEMYDLLVSKSLTSGRKPILWWIFLLRQSRIEIPSSRRLNVFYKNIFIPPNYDVDVVIQ